jgi:hypothetical protein
MKRKTRMFLRRLFTRESFSLVSFSLFFALTNLSTQASSINNTRALYSISDLEVLQQANAYSEFFKHAHDILPTKRTKYWLNMVSNMAQAYIDDSTKQDNHDQPTFLKIEEISKWPELRGDEFFQIKRSRFSINYFKVCLSTLKPLLCKQQMLSFWKTARKDAETGFQLLQYFAGFFPRHDSWPLLRDILTKPAGKFYCGKPLVSSLTFEHLEKQHLYSDSSEKVKIYISQMSSEQCWKTMSSRATTWLDNTPVSQTKSLFVALSATQQLSSTDRSTWLTRYYLNSPGPGKLLNWSWSELEKLANDYSRRQSVLKRLLSLDPLPGNLFEHLSRKKNQTLFEHFTQSFPEYVQEYSKTCVAYREGRGVFPRGNPTIQCQKLMAYDKEQKRKRISQEVHLRYSGTTKRQSFTGN